MVNIVLRIRELKEKIPIEILRDTLCKQFNINKHERKFIVKDSEKNYIRISFLDSKERDNAINILLKMKLENRRIIADNKKIDILKIEKEQYSIKIEMANIWEITFEKPTFLKIGSIFKEKIDAEMFFIWLMRRYNALYETREKIEKSELDNIQTLEENFEKIGIKIGNFFINGFKGSLKLDISKVTPSTKKLLEKLLNFVIYSGYGYKNEIGYGTISIKYQEETYE